MEECENDTLDNVSDLLLHSRNERFQDLRASEAETFNDLLARHLPAEVRDWNCDCDGWSFRFRSVSLEIRNYVNIPIYAEAASDTMTRKFLDPLRAELRDLMSELYESRFESIGFVVLLLQMAEKCVVWQELWRNQSARQKTRKLIKASDLERAANSKQKKQMGERQKTGTSEPFKAEEVHDWLSALENSSGLDVASVEDTAEYLLGRSIADICKDITHPGWFKDKHYAGRLVNDDIRIVHVEPVFRYDLARRFLRRKNDIHQDLLRMSYYQLRASVSIKKVPRYSRDDNVEGLARALAESSVTFHGAHRYLLESIVRYGFIIPGEAIGGTGRELDIARGASYGIGVYSTPDPYIAMHYAGWEHGMLDPHESLSARNIPGTRLLVCATLMGRAATVERAEARRKHGVLVGSAHSHVSPDQSEYIVFSSAQIIPCYVLHLAQSDTAVHVMPSPSKPVLKSIHDRLYATEPKDYDRHGNEIRWAGDEQRKKRAMKEGALKYFPYGFGTATGTNFVIEDVADVSDDEEVYGEFQDQRIEQEHEIREKRDVDGAGASWLDQYQMVRKTHTEVVL